MGSRNSSHGLEQSRFHVKLLHLTTCAVAFLLTVVLVACGGSYGTGTSSLAANAIPATPAPSSPIPMPSTAPAVIMVGDAPSDRVLSFELNIASVSLTQADNTVVPLTNAPHEVEVTHLAGSAEPFAKLSIPQGTYSSVTIVVSSAEVVFLDATGKQVDKEFSNLNTTVTVPLNPQLVVTNAPLILTLDVNVASSVVIDPQSGNVTLNPTFALIPGSLPPAGQEGQENPENGELEHIVGQVTNVSGTTFTIMLGQNGVSLPFNTDSNTKFDNFSSLGSLPVNATVRVEGITMQDGSLLATEVELLNALQTENQEQDLDGIVTATTGTPATSFMLLLHDGSGSNMNMAMMGSSITVNIDSNANFKIDDSGLDISGMNMPAFSAATLSPAQQVEIETDAPMASGSPVNANSVKLEQQTLTGTISSPIGGQFILTVADDSAFALLTGVKTITVITDSRTQHMDEDGNGGGDGGGDGGNGGNGGSSTMKVRGLLFFNPQQNSFVLVAKRLRNGD